MRRVFYYEAFDVTTNTVKFRQRTKKSEGNAGDTQATSSRNSELGYIYMKKALYMTLLQPQVLRIIVEVDTEPANPFPEV